MAVCFQLQSEPFLCSQLAPADLQMHRVSLQADYQERLHQVLLAYVMVRTKHVAGFGSENASRRNGMRAASSIKFHHMLVLISNPMADSHKQFRA